MNPAAALLGLLCVVVVVIPVSLWIGSVILRAAVGMTNRVIGGVVPDDLAYYDQPAAYRHHSYDPSELAIPVPSSGRAMGILLLIGVVDFVVKVAFVMAAGAGGGDGSMAGLIALPVSLVVHGVMLSSLLPTTLGRAFLVLLFQFLIVLLIVAVVVAVVVGMGVVAGMGHR